MRPNEEILSSRASIVCATDPTFQAVVSEHGEGAEGDRARDQRRDAARRRGGAISEDGHSVLVDFEITGEDVDASVNVVESEDAVKGLQAAHPEYNVEQFGVRVVGQEPERDVRERPRQGRACSPCR